MITKENSEFFVTFKFFKLSTNIFLMALLTISMGHINCFSIGKYANQVIEKYPVEPYYSSSSPSHRNGYYQICDIPKMNIFMQDPIYFYPKQRYSEVIKKTLDLGMQRDYSGNIAAMHLMGLAAAQSPKGPGRKKKNYDYHLYSS
ncbi:uncharacterized protein LOC135932067 isoform X1 [Gordionus sp. m RMFG-2023]|uniref:uncharacterized protein LOC135932067 isoform X1 n=1 Tax=Gordionus sp. m RMFG-2023 TaxID=3053472 RepID=UPI0031FC56B7